MEDSCGPTKPKRFLMDVKAGTSSSNGGEITGGNVKQMDLPHIVVEKILENLKFKDLLQCSLVNKVWNYEARRLLREKHKCALVVDLDKPPAEEMIIELNTTLAAAEWPLPYGSLCIRKKKECDTDSRKGWMLENYELVNSAIKNIILRAGPFEIVQVDCVRDTSLEFSVIITDLMAEVEKTVKVLIVKNTGGWDLFREASRLPELEKLEINLTAIISYSVLLCIRNVLQYSEKLETVGLMSSSWLIMLDKIPEARKLAVVKEFTCADMYIDHIRAAKFAELEPKLEKLYIPRQPESPDLPDLPDERNIAMSLLLSSRASLFELQVTYEVLQEIRRKKPFAVFENVRRLTMDAPCHMDHGDLDGNPTIIALFPKLEDLKVITEEAPPANDLSDED